MPLTRVGQRRRSVLRHQSTPAVSADRPQPPAIQSPHNAAAVAAARPALQRIHCRRPADRSPAAVRQTADSRPAIPPRAPAPPPSGDLFQPGQTWPRVGDKFIFYGDVAPTVEHDA